MNINKVDVDDTLSVQFEEPIMIKTEPLDFEPSEPSLDSLVVISKRKKKQYLKQIHSQKLEILRLKQKLKRSEIMRCEQFLKIKILTELRSHFNVSVESMKMETDESTQTGSNEEIKLDNKSSQTSKLEMKQLQIQPKVVIVSHSPNFWYEKRKVINKKLDCYNTNDCEKDVYGIKSRKVEKNTIKLKKIVDEVVNDLINFNQSLESKSRLPNPFVSYENQILCDKIAYRDILELLKSKIDCNVKSANKGLEVKEWNQERECSQLKNFASQIIADLLKGF